MCVYLLSGRVGETYWINRQRDAAHFVAVATSQGVPIPLSTALPTQVGLSFVIGIYSRFRDCMVFLSRSFYEYTVPKSIRLRSALWLSALYTRKETIGLQVRCTRSCRQFSPREVSFSLGKTSFKFTHSLRFRSRSSLDSVVIMLWVGWR